jgi:hypothetical protein
MSPLAAQHGVGQFVFVVGRPRRNAGETRSQLLQHGEQTDARFTGADMLEEQRHVFVPTMLADFVVKRAVAQNDDAALELGHEDQERGASASAVQPALRKQLKGASMNGTVGAGRRNQESSAPPTTTSSSNASAGSRQGSR